jgi:hypothetical protein
MNQEREKGTRAQQNVAQRQQTTKSGQQELHENSILTHLVVYFLRSILQEDSLLEDVALFGQLLALRPVVESACDEHFFGGMLPRSETQPKCQLSSASHSVNQ